MAMSEPSGWLCPGCEQPAALALSGQAFCGNDDCAVVAWDPSKSLVELAANVHRIGERGDGQ
jgi:hypothetical protein